MPFLSHLFLNMSICVIIYTLKQTHGYVLDLNPRFCFGFKLAWVEKTVGLVLVGLKMTLNWYGSSMVLRDKWMGMVQVWNHSHVYFQLYLCCVVVSGNIVISESWSLWILSSYSIYYVHCVPLSLTKGVDAATGLPQHVSDGFFQH